MTQSAPLRPGFLVLWAASGRAGRSVDPHARGRPCAPYAGRDPWAAAGTAQRLRRVLPRVPAEARVAEAADAEVVEDVDLGAVGGELGRAGGAVALVEAARLRVRVHRARLVGLAVVDAQDVDRLVGPRHELPVEAGRRDRR